MRGLDNSFYPIIIFKQGTSLLIPLIECFGIAIENPLDQQACRVVPILAHKEVIVVGHEAIRDQGQV